MTNVLNDGASLPSEASEDGKPGYRLFLARDPELGGRDLHIDELGKFGECSMRDIAQEEDSNQWSQQVMGGSGQRLNVLGLIHVGNTVLRVLSKQVHSEGLISL